MRPLQSRVDPFGNLFADRSRGLFMGNRGGRIHSDDRTLGARRWASRQWICCVLAFKNRRREVWGHSYTELFFLDEVTAFAAGHRPCFECRRKDAERFAAAWQASRGLPVPPRAADMDRVLHGERLIPTFRIGHSGRAALAASAGIHNHRLGLWIPGSRASLAPRNDEALPGSGKRVHPHAIDDLPDGAMVAHEHDAFAVRGSALLRWVPMGYGPAVPRPRQGRVAVLTPPSILAVLRQGYPPRWHPTAEHASATASAERSR